MEDDLREELKTRKRIYEIYAKDESDFENKDKYNDYLEMREGIILSLVAGENVESVESQIARYKQDNQESIHRHRRRKLEEASTSFTSSLAKLTVDAASQAPGVEGKTTRGPQPLPLESGIELTEEGSLKVRQRARTSSEWLMVARAAGWSRHFYYDFAKAHALENLRR